MFWRSARERESIAEELLGRRQPTQLGRAFAECGIEPILANSPQAKGRIERLFGTFQDRLVSELRLAGIVDLTSANAFLGGYLMRHNSRFAVAAADGAPAWRTLPNGLSIESVCCFKYSRVVAADNTVRVDSVVLQLPPRVRGSWSNLRVELRQSPRRLVQRARARRSRTRTLGRAGQPADAAGTRLEPRAGERRHAAAARQESPLAALRSGQPTRPTATDGIPEPLTVRIPDQRQRRLRHCDSVSGEVWRQRRPVRLAASATKLPRPITTIVDEIARPATVAGSGVACPAVTSVAIAQA